ncbi:Gfo/Idh/MocA family oxidoreductase [Campylobacter sp. MIT 21-1685]|uniref:Gfo/Idh/MocA family protein n=1 Tax=unclassified Campylobacter TaxID=2593542 RepID=UPI00224B85C2|nr:MULTISPECIES: Gfo/Idh/MocA family oxidoreductase [unclassified Campylobacter]MCX2683727.1 Gfo/Idh/MocA family oxidoreductase [Campylobacter sp. MIT 21-1684]MCX2752009.1 Gfo/Idh/MocA family oxidoreductase [Campylobacter sp. MIT 21-1682]MCX2808208.1 Gfo/Idh/MocA family oxidoreductase [Campylobacter sp. MIT 21-1685]
MKVLIIGFGSIAKKHCIALQRMGIEVAVVSKSITQAELQEYSINLFYRLLEEVPLDQFEFFIIANITSSHYDTLKELDKKIQGKTILVEKPLFEKTLRFQSTHNDIFIAYLLRFNPIITALKELLATEKLYFANLLCNSYLPTWRQSDYTHSYSAKKELGGGVLLDLSHELDLAFFLFGDLRLDFAQQEKISELQINSDDFVFIALSHKTSNTFKVHIQLDYFSKFSQRYINIHTTEKSFKADLLLNEIQIYTKEGKKEIIPFESDTITTLQKMHEKLLQKDEKLCTLKEALNVLKLCDEIRERYG